MGYKKNPYVSRHDIHYLDGLFYYIGSRWVMFPLWFASLGFGAFVSYIEESWTWLSRFGVIGVLVGTLLTLSPLFRDGIYLSNAKAFGFGSSDEDGKTSTTSAKSRATSLNIVYGVVFIIISSVINGFGDYFASLYK